MNRIIVIITLLTTFAFNAFAQMSDDQIIEYVKQQNSAGKDQKQIAKELVARGVSIQQLEKLRARYQSQSTDATRTNTTTDFSRNRINNGNLGLDLEFPEELWADPADTIKIFGHDIFRSQNLSFEPAMNIATPANYTLGAGDEVILDIYGASQFSGNFKISPDGTITIPNQGPINIAGLNVSQAQAKVQRAIGAHYQDSSIKLTVGQTRTITVNILGEVKTPGTYTLSAFATVFNALYLAGGITNLGTMREVKVSRNGHVITKVDVYDYIVNGRLTGNIMLRDNDVILVGPYLNLVKVEGKIKRPMFYEMKKAESLQSLLTFSGGFTGDAYKKKIRVERKTDDGLTVHNVDEWDFNSFKLEDGDVAVIDTIISRYKNTVQVKGAVFRPGYYKLDSNVNSVKTLIEQAGGLVEQANTTRAVLRRVKADRTYQTLTINLASIIQGNAPDAILQNEDELIISSFEKQFESQTVSIYGDVYKAGTYKYSEDETVEDLITEAGGLLESASLVNIEVARRKLPGSCNQDENIMAKVYSLTLQNGLPIEGETGFVLKPFDIVTIHRSPYYEVQKMVYVDGEVYYGGAYALSNKDERLSSLLARAGGMTKTAYADGVQLIRKISAKEMDIQRLKLSVAKTAADSLEIENTLNITTYNIGIDVKKALSNPGCASDIVLQEGDSIYVPRLNNVVKISGEVMFPNTVAFDDGRKVEYYINQAGGINRDGKRSRGYIIYPNGNVSKLNSGKILPGCEIVIPKKQERKVDTTRTSMWLALASTVATIAAVLTTALRK